MTAELDLVLKYFLVSTSYPHQPHKCVSKKISVVQDSGIQWSQEFTTWDGYQFSSKPFKNLISPSHWWRMWIGHDCLTLLVFDKLWDISHSPTLVLEQSHFAHRLILLNYRCYIMARLATERYLGEKVLSEKRFIFPWENLTSQLKCLAPILKVKLHDALFSSFLFRFGKLLHDASWWIWSEQCAGLVK